MVLFIEGPSLVNQLDTAALCHAAPQCAEKLYLFLN